MAWLGKAAEGGDGAKLVAILVKSSRLASIAAAVVAVGPCQDKHHDEEKTTDTAITAMSALTH